MTTRNFSAIQLPHPKYTLDIGCLHLKEKNLPLWIPRFCNQIQLVEVCRSVLQSTGYDIHSIMGKFIIIENARPELFLRRDFITQFVDTGTIHLTHEFTSNELESYQIYTADNVLSLVMGEKLYRRFGMIGRKVVPSRVKKSKSKSFDYKIDIDLKDGKIKRSNKYQDKLMQTFRRLNPINKLYFRFVPNESTAATITATTTSEANVKSLEFFRYVINEYAIDGFKPVPLTGCHEVCHKLERKWTNYHQRHPILTTNFMTPRDVKEPNRSDHDGMNNGSSCSLGNRTIDIQRNPEILSKVVDIIDWLGYQLLSLDCDREEISCKYPNDLERLDVSCTQIGGLMDFRQIQENLGRIFGHDDDDDDDGCYNKSSDNSSSNTVLRALILYNNNNRQDTSSDTGVVLLQAEDDAKDLITVIGL